jgi:hypothetical protein
MSHNAQVEILDLLFRYGRALDEKDWLGYAALFAYDAELILPWGPPVPRAEIAADTADKLGRFAATHHMSTNQQIIVDDVTAATRSYVQAVHVSGDGSIWTLGGRYDNEYRRENGAWRFARVRLAAVWETGTAPQLI